MTATPSGRIPLPRNCASHLSRRAALVRLGGVAALTLAVGGRRAAAQEATPPVAADLPPVLQEFIAAQEARDLDRLLALHAEDAVVEEVPTGAVYDASGGRASY